MPSFAAICLKCGVECAGRPTGRDVLAPAGRDDDQNRTPTVMGRNLPFALSDCVGVETVGPQM
jgi:hypothetical protein